MLMCWILVYMCLLNAEVKLQQLRLTLTSSTGCARLATRVHQRDPGHGRPDGAAGQDGVPRQVLQGAEFYLFNLNISRFGWINHNGLQENGISALKLMAIARYLCLWSDVLKQNCISSQGNLRNAEHLQRREARLRRRVPALPHLRLPQGKEVSPAASEIKT